MIDDVQQAEAPAIILTLVAATVCLFALLLLHAGGTVICWIIEGLASALGLSSAAGCPGGVSFSRTVNHTPPTPYGGASAVPSQPAVEKPLPACGSQTWVTPGERDALRMLAADPRFASLREMHGGLILLGYARELAKSAKSRELVEQMILSVVQWRAHVGADQILATRLPSHLASVQVESHVYGRTRGGLPVVVEAASSWHKAICAARALGIAPAEFAQGRVLWSERCLHRVFSDLESGSGQFVLVMDFGGTGDLGWSDVMPLWGFVKEAIAGVSMRYANCCKRTYVVRPPRAISLLWRLLGTVLPPETKAKICVLNASGASLALEDFPADVDLIVMAPDSLPEYLGGSCTVAEAALHEGVVGGCQAPSQQE